MFDGMQARRLPVYLLLDCSASMGGTKIVQVNQGVQTMYQEFMADPRSANTVHISIIPFSDTAYQMDLVPIGQFTPPQLTAGGGRALGAALDLLNQSLDSDIKVDNRTTGEKGDYKPLVFIVTDGPPTDHWQEQALRLRYRAKGRPTILALAIGTDVDERILQQIATTVLRMDKVTLDSLRSFFQWTDAEITSTSIPPRDTLTSATLPPPPGNIMRPDLPMPSSLGTVSQTQPRVFVSHSSIDTEWCTQFVEAIHRGGVDAWYDQKGLYVGAQWIRTIEQEIEGRDVFLVIISPDSLTSEWVKKEIDLALTSHKHIVGVIHRPTKVTGFLRTYQLMDAVGLSAEEAARQVSKFLIS